VGLLTEAEPVRVVCGDALEFLAGLPDASVDVVFTSPPYTTARTYGISADRGSAEWVQWMRPVVVEMCRVSAGLVFLNVSDQVKDCHYQNAPEWLHADLTRLDRLAAVRPYIWFKANPADDDAPCGGQPGSGSRHFHRNAYEPIYGYSRSDRLPPRWSNNTAFGTPPRRSGGGKMTQRLRAGRGRRTHESTAYPFATSTRATVARHTSTRSPHLAPGLALSFHRAAYRPRQSSQPPQVEQLMAWPQPAMCSGRPSARAPSSVMLRRSSHHGVLVCRRTTRAHLRGRNLAALRCHIA
jgi:hypothetical protein